MAPACAQRAVDAPAVHARHVVRAQRQMERQVKAHDDVERAVERYQRHIARFVPQLTHLPRYVTQGERGAGFAELARAILAARP